MRTQRVCTDTFRVQRFEMIGVQRFEMIGVQRFEMIGKGSKVRGNSNNTNNCRGVCGDRLRQRKRMTKRQLGGATRSL